MGILKHKLLAASPLLEQVATGAVGGIRSGNAGDTVVRIQLALLTVGERLPKSTKELSALPDASYGEETIAAVKRFQTSRGLAADGITGRQ
jgi:peptidoglycan hydrolase-like protein with peptidoglycan-binding domain